MDPELGGHSPLFEEAAQAMQECIGVGENGLYDILKLIKVLPAFRCNCSPRAKTKRVNDVLA
jgi:hypothetical protein